MKKSKKIAIGVLTISLVAATAIGGTLAFLTDSEKVTNTFDITDLDIKIEEPNWDPEEGEELTPGDTLYKDPTVTAVENNSYMRVIVKIIDNNETIPNPDYDADTNPDAEPTITNPNYQKVITDTERLELILPMIRYDSTYDAEGTPITSGILSDAKYSLEELNAKKEGTEQLLYPTVNPDFTQDTTKSTDGTYYYNYSKVLNEGDNAVLFTNVVVPVDYSQKQVDKIGKFQVEVYAQAIQAKNFDSAEDAFAALDEEITNGTLQSDYGVVGTK